jgi:ribosome-binding protein aMBF1 (putative translation factor)
MKKQPETGFDRYFDEQMRDPEVRRAYETSRARVDMVDGLVRALDEAREAQGITKAELARRLGSEPAAVRRLLTSSQPNPTMTTFVAAADALGLEVRVTRKQAAPSKGRARVARIRVPS